MSARLGFNEIPYISWKGKTFSQITADIRKNVVNPKTNNTILTKRVIMKPLPLKIYRKEIASVPMNTCNRRVSSKVFTFETPGGNITNSKIADTLANGYVHTIDMTLPNLKGEYPGSSCDANILGSNPVTDNRCLSAQNNAKRRVRSSGMIIRKFNVINNNDTYYTNTNQYLDSRNKKFTQNTYHMLRQGNAANLPGTAAALSNVYASNTISHCKGANVDALTTAYVPVYYKPNNSRFAEQGAVSSSARILRLKYDTVTGAGANLQASFGKATANALAYSTTDSSLYSLKTKTGYPLKQTPRFAPFTGELRPSCSTNFSI
jgi:hypothetical protein